MKRFKIKVPVDYISGHLRYGHLEAIIEAETKEQAIEKAKNYDNYEIEVDDYEIDDHGEPDYENMKLEEVE